MRLFYVIIAFLSISELNAQYLFQRFEGKPGNLIGASTNMTPDGKHLGIFNAINGQPLSKVEIYELKGNIFEKTDEIQSSPEIGNFFFSENGNRLLIANGDESPFRLGSVTVFEKQNGFWKNLGNSIFETDVKNIFGAGLDFSLDGNSFIVSTPDYNGTGLVEVYTLNGATWVPKGSVFSGISGSRIGEGTTISSNGNRIAFSSPTRSEIKVYDFINNNWVQSGTTITGLGGKIELSADGNTLVCGGLDDENTRIYNFIGNNWVKHNNEITHNSPDDYSWNVIKIDMTKDAKHFILSYLNAQTQKTKFIVADLISNAWIQRNDPFYNEDKEEYYGISGEISDDGKLIVVSHPQSNYAGFLAGEVHSFVDDLRSYAYVSSFLDINKNGKREINEPLFEKAKYSINDAFLVAQGIENQSYITVFSGSNKVAVVLPESYKTTIDSVQTISIDANSLDSIIFPIIPRNDTYIGNTKVLKSDYVCNRSVPISIHVNNEGFSPLSASVTINYGSLMKSNLTPQPSEDGTDHVTWTQDYLGFGEQSVFKLSLAMPNEMFTGSVIDVSAKVYYYKFGTSELVDSFVQDLSGVLRCSFDPNDKAVTPVGLGDTKLTLKNQYLNYKVRFQNTGNFPAENVVIEDVLDNMLDISTFELINTSHPLYATEIKGKKVKFIFKGINLPDSVNNEPESHGFIEYRIKTVKNIPENTKVRNTAFIYFDLNKPVVTNTTENVMVTSFSPISNLEDVTISQFSVYPNPASGYIILDNAIEDAKEIKIITNDGKIVMTEKLINKGRKLINIEPLNPGKYNVLMINDSYQVIGVSSFIKNNQ